MKFGIYTSGGAGRLKKMLLEKPFSRYEVDVAFILHDNGHDSAIEELAAQANIPVFFIDYEKDGIHRQKGLHVSETILRLMQQYGAGYLFCFGSKILRGRLLEAFENRLINFHPSILPMFPGVQSIDRAREAQTFLLGNTAHFIDQGIDTGPVIMQSLGHHARYPDYDSIMDLQILMLLQIATWIKSGRLSVAGRVVSVAGADYEASPFVPKLEISINSST